LHNFAALWRRGSVLGS